MHRLAGVVVAPGRAGQGQDALRDAHEDSGALQDKIHGYKYQAKLAVSAASMPCSAKEMSCRLRPYKSPGWHQRGFTGGLEPACCSPQTRSSRRTGLRSRPASVSTYSSRGGRRL